MEPRKTKLYINQMILEVLKRDGKAKRDVLTASLSLETGFNKVTISDILDDMKLASWIKLKDNIITPFKIPRHQKQELLK